MGIFQNGISTACLQALCEAEKRAHQDTTLVGPQRPSLIYQAERHHEEREIPANERISLEAPGTGGYYAAQQKQQDDALVLLSSLSPAQLQGLMQQLQSLDGSTESQARAGAHSQQHQQQGSTPRQDLQPVGARTASTAAVLREHDRRPTALLQEDNSSRSGSVQPAGGQSPRAPGPATSAVAAVDGKAAGGSSMRGLVAEIPSFKPPEEPRRPNPLQEWQSGGPHINLPGGNWMHSQEYATTSAALVKTAEASGRVTPRLPQGERFDASSSDSDEEIQGCPSPRGVVGGQLGQGKVTALAMPSRSGRGSPGRSPLGSPREPAVSGLAGPGSSGFAAAGASAGSPRGLQNPAVARGVDGSPRRSGSFSGTPRDMGAPTAAAVQSRAVLGSPAGSPRVIWGPAAAVAAAAAPPMGGASGVRRVSNEIVEEGGVPYPAAPQPGIAGALSRRRSIPGVGILEGHKSLDKIPEVPGNEERSTSTDG